MKNITKRPTVQDELIAARKEIKELQAKLQVCYAALNAKK